MQKGTALYDMVKNGRAAKAAVLTQRSDQVLVRGVQPSIQTAGGVNLPKIIKCEGSDGCVYKQLVKGKDDTRQDAVMQQAFELVNVLLHKVNSRQRALRLRTYRVVPLAQTAGVLQWVEDTIPLTQYLVGATRTLLGMWPVSPSDMTTGAREDEGGAGAPAAGEGSSASGVCPHHGSSETGAFPRLRRERGLGRSRVKGGGEA